MFYFSFNYGDFSRKTAGLTDRNKLAYLYLVSMYYEQEAPISHDITTLAFKAGITTDDMMVLLNAFFVPTEEAWHDPKIDKALEAYKSKSKERSEAGKRGAKARWKPELVI